MAKIPRIAKREQQPSAVPAGVSFAAEDEGAVLGVAADIVGALGETVTRAERAAARRLQAAQDAKQAIVDQIEASRRSTDFEQGLNGISESLRAENADSPLKAAPEFLRLAREGMDAAVKAAPNLAVGQQIARDTASRTRIALRDMNSWASARQTQKAKNDLTVLTNQTTRGAESVGSSEGLAVYLAGKEAELRPHYENIFGRDAAKRMQEMKTDATRAWALAQGDTNPVGILNALDEKTGPLVDNLDASQRETLRKASKASFEGQGKQREMDIIRKGVSRNRDIYNAFSTGSLDAGTLLAAKKEVDEQRKALKVDPNFSDKSKAAQLKSLDSRERYLDAIESVRRRQNAFDAEDDVGTVTRLYEQYETLFRVDGGLAGKDLSKWLEFQELLAVAYADEKISGGTFNTMKKGISIALPEAIAAESKNAGGLFGIDVLGGVFGYSFRSPQQAGNHLLNQRFNNDFKELSDEKKNDVRRSYIEQLNNRAEEGRGITEGEARKMALRALSLESGVFIPGTD